MYLLACLTFVRPLSISLSITEPSPKSFQLILYCDVETTPCKAWGHPTFTGEDKIILSQTWEINLFLQQSVAITVTLTLFTRLHLQFTP